MKIGSTSAADGYGSEGGTLDISKELRRMGMRNGLLTLNKMSLWERPGNLSPCFSKNFLAACNTIISRYLDTQSGKTWKVSECALPVKTHESMSSIKLITTSNNLCHSSKRGLNPPLLRATPPFWFSTPFLKYHPSTPSSVNHPLFNKNPPNPPLFKPKFCIDQKLHEIITRNFGNLPIYIAYRQTHTDIDRFKKGNLMGFNGNYISVILVIWETNF